MDIELAKKNSKNRWVYIVSGVIMLFFLIIIFLINRMRRIERAKFLSLMEKINMADSVAAIKTEENIMPQSVDKKFADPLINQFESENLPPLGKHPLGNTPHSETNEKEEYYIPAETEKRVLNQLAELEKSTFFLQKQMSLSYLSDTL